MTPVATLDPGVPEVSSNLGLFFLLAAERRPNDTEQYPRDAEGSAQSPISLGTTVSWLPSDRPPFSSCTGHIHLHSSRLSAEPLAGELESSKIACADNRVSQLPIMPLQVP